MPAYVITNVRVSDVEKYKGYQALSPRAITDAGGEFLARGGTTHVLEGDFVPERVVVAKFPSVDAAKAFYNSALYTEARSKRAGATAFFNMFIVEGI